MPYMTIRQIRHEMNLNSLRELGCEVISVQGVMFYVKYKLDGIKIAYIYHIDTHNKYFLERIKPYVVAAGEFDTEEEVVEAIKIDLEQFKNAKQSKNFDAFIEVDTEIFKAVRAFEDLFLYYNISKEDTVLIKNKITDLMNSFKEVTGRSERVFHEKDPDFLKDL